MPRRPIKMGILSRRPLGGVLTENRKALAAAPLRIDIYTHPWYPEARSVLHNTPQRQQERYSVEAR